jgi:ribosome biogenesis protein ERB1
LQDEDGDDSGSASEYSGLEDEEADSDESSEADAEDGSDDEEDDEAMDDSPFEGGGEAKQPSKATKASVGSHGVAATTGAVRFDQLDTFEEQHDEYKLYQEFLGSNASAKGELGDDEAQEAAPKGTPITDGPMEVLTSDSDTSDDEHARDGIGNIPLHWYNDEEHVGYNLDGERILKSGVEKDRLDKFLAKVDDPDYGRTIVDPLTKREIRLSDEDIDMIKRIQGGEFPDSAYDPYQDYVDFFTHEKRVTPISNVPEPKGRFLPSKWEHKTVMKMVRAIRKGWLKPKSDVKKEEESYDIWKDTETAGDATAPRSVVCLGVSHFDSVHVCRHARMALRKRIVAQFCLAWFLSFLWWNRGVVGGTEGRGQLHVTARARANRRERSMVLAQYIGRRPAKAAREHRGAKGGAAGSRRILQPAA